VYRSLRGDVVEGEHIVVFVDFLGGNFSLDDFTEKAIFTHNRDVSIFYFKIVKILKRCHPRLDRGSPILMTKKELLFI
jgi:hypothetical protein